MADVRRLQDYPVHSRVVPRSTATYGTISLPSSEADASSLIDLDTYRGHRKDKPRFERLDLVTLLTSILCLAVSAFVIRYNELFKYHFSFANQLITVVTVLGVENLCMTRFAQRLFLLSECRYGQSTLHNLEGIIQWSIFVPKLSGTWRLSIGALYLLPLALGVIYNFFAEGSSTVDLGNEHANCGPTTSPDLGPITSNRNCPPPIAIVATSAAPFLSHTMSREVFNSSSLPHPYGFNTLLLSNRSAAALDAPTTEYIAGLQSRLSASETIDLTAIVRATIATHSHIAEETRANQTYWQEFSRVQSLIMRDTNSIKGEPLHHLRFVHGILQCGTAGGDAPEYWNGSWFFSGGYSLWWSPNATGDYQQNLQAFTEKAQRFDLSRHLCTATWTITDTSIRLSHGKCNKQPLPHKYQWMQNAQTFIAADFGELLYEYFWCFDIDIDDPQNCDTPWRIPIQTTAIAHAYQAAVAKVRGWVNMQPEGPLWKLWANDSTVWQEPLWGGTLQYIERYPVEIHLKRTTQALRKNWALYWTAAVMPVLTLGAFLAITFYFHDVPLGRNFGILALLAGVDRSTLHNLVGASFSGRTTRRVYLQIRTVPPRYQDGSDSGLGEIEYRLGERAQNDRLQPGVAYE